MGCGTSKTKIQDLTVDLDNGKLGIIISGAPASGKGTQCERIVEQHGVVHISTGDILRQHIKDQTHLGQEVSKFITAGHLVPDNLIINIVRARILEPDCRERGWLLDGFPRTRAQADAIINAGVVPNKFIYLHVHDEILIERVVGRRLDPLTGHIYHVKHSPPPDDVAARCIHRPDDTEEAARTRLHEFHGNNNEILEAYAEVIHKFNGEQEPDEVAYEIDEYLKDPKSDRYWYDSVIGTPNGSGSVTPSREQAALRKQKALDEDAASTAGASRASTPDRAQDELAEERADNILQESASLEKLLAEVESRESVVAEMRAGELKEAVDAGNDELADGLRARCDEMEAGIIKDRALVAERKAALSGDVDDVESVAESLEEANEEVGEGEIEDVKGEAEEDVKEGEFNE